jgi:iron complex transport system ATP-binding protein
LFNRVETSRRMSQETAIVATEIRAGYGRRTVLHDFSFSLARGEVVSIIGPNGSGKSTLLKALVGLVPLRHGQVLFWGQEVRTLSPRERARQVAFVPQGPTPPVGLTVEEVVSQGRFPHRASFFLVVNHKHQDAVEEALQRTALLPLRHRSVTTLSGGECQRVWLATALAQEPALLLLDEPTSYLDIAYQLDLLELIAQLNREKQLTVLMALHDLNLAARFSHRIIALTAGRIVAHGSPRQVFTPALLSEVFGVSVTFAQIPGISAPILYPLQTERRQQL